MIKEKSCGAVIYKKVNGELLFLVEFMSLGHVSLAKGHMEKDETEEQTALREIKEETSLDVLLDTSFRKVITYSPYEGIIKDVVFFVAETKDDRKPLDEHDQEVNDLKYFTFDKAYSLLTHATDKEVLKEAYFYILKKENKNG